MLSWALMTRKTLKAMSRVASRFILLQTEFGFNLGSHVVRECGADVGDARVDLVDDDIATFLAYGLDSVEHLGGNGLHLLLRGFLKGLLVVLILLSNII